jgi:hypothetical protein
MAVIGRNRAMSTAKGGPFRVSLTILMKSGPHNNPPLSKIGSFREFVPGWRIVSAVERLTKIKPSIVDDLQQDGKGYLTRTKKDGGFKFFRIRYMNKNDKLSL